MTDTTNRTTELTIPASIAAKLDITVEDVFLFFEPAGSDGHARSRAGSCRRPRGKRGVEMIGTTLTQTVVLAIDRMAREEKEMKYVYMKEAVVSRERAQKILSDLGRTGDYVEDGDYYISYDSKNREYLTVWGQDEPVVENTSSTSWL